MDKGKIPERRRSGNYTYLGTYLSLCPMMPQNVEISGYQIVFHYCTSEIVEHSCFDNFQGTMKLTSESLKKRCP